MVKFKLVWEEVVTNWALVEIKFVWIGFDYSEKNKFGQQAAMRMILVVVMMVAAVAAVAAAAVALPGLPYVLNSIILEKSKLYESDNES